MKPVSGILRDDPGSRHTILSVGLIQLIEFAKTTQFVAVALQTRVFHGECGNLFAQRFIVREGGSHFLLILEIAVNRTAHPIHTGLDRQQKITHRSPDGAKLFVFNCRQSYHSDAGYAENNENQTVIRYFHNRPHSLKL